MVRDDEGIRRVEKKMKEGGSTEEEGFWDFGGSSPSIVPV